MFNLKLNNILLKHTKFLANKPQRSLVSYQFLPLLMEIVKMAEIVYGTSD